VYKLWSSSLCDDLPVICLSHCFMFWCIQVRSPLLHWWVLWTVTSEPNKCDNVYCILCAPVLQMSFVLLFAYFHSLDVHVSQTEAAHISVVIYNEVCLLCCASSFWTFTKIGNDSVIIPIHCCGYIVL
jgi:hypothetical protein